MDTIGVWCGILVFGWVTVSLIRMIVAGVRTGTIALWVGRYRSRRVGPPVTRAANPRAFWAIVVWYGFLSCVTGGITASVVAFEPLWPQHTVADTATPEPAPTPTPTAEAPSASPMTFEQLLDQFRARGIVRGGDVLLAPRDAIDVIGESERSDIAVIGIDALTVEPNKTIPHPDLIADCSSPRATAWSEYRDAANQCARLFLERLASAHPSLKVSLTGLTANEWAAREH